MLIVLVALCLHNGGPVVFVKWVWFLLVNLGISKRAIFTRPIQLPLQPPLFQSTRQHQVAVFPLAALCLGEVVLHSAFKVTSETLSILCVEDLQAEGFSVLYAKKQATMRELVCFSLFCLVFVTVQGKICK